MQVYIDEKSINTKAKIGRFLFFAGLGLMVISLLVASRTPELINTIFIIAMFGLLGSQIGSGMMNRWSKQPRMDEIIAAAVKGMDSNFHLFQYKLGADHVLAAPTGVYVLVPEVQEGMVLYEDGKWFTLKTKRKDRKVKRKLKDLAAMIQRETASANKKLSSVLGDSAVEAIPVVVFLHGEAIVDLENAPVLCVHGKKIKPFLRRLPKAESLSEEAVEKLKELYN